jgi:hypothetical protein
MYMSYSLSQRELVTNENSVLVKAVVATVPNVPSWADLSAALAELNLERVADGKYHGRGITSGWINSRVHALRAQDRE